jgi:hypothetical protein
MCSCVDFKTMCSNYATGYKPHTNVKFVFYDQIVHTRQVLAWLGWASFKHGLGVELVSKSFAVDHANCMTTELLLYCYGQIGTMFQYCTTIIIYDPITLKHGWHTFELIITHQLVLLEADTKMCEVPPRAWMYRFVYKTFQTYMICINVDLPWLIYLIYVCVISTQCVGYFC